jgi:alpha-methylacyl-CoA racemase
MQPAPAPRFDRTPAQVQHGARIPGQDSNEVLSSFGFSEAEIATLNAANVVTQVG